MNKREDRIEKLEAKKQQIDAQIDKLKALNSEEKRKLDTRKKILLGSWVLNQIDNGEIAEEEVMAKMDKYLTRNIDRRVFDLPLLEKKNNQDSKESRLLAINSCF